MPSQRVRLGRLAREDGATGGTGGRAMIITGASAITDPSTPPAEFAETVDAAQGTLFEPTEAQRPTVQVAAAVDVPTDDIAVTLDIHPATLHETFERETGPRHECGHRFRQQQPRLVQQLRSRRRSAELAGTTPLVTTAQDAENPCLTCIIVAALASRSPATNDRCRVMNTPLAYAWLAAYPAFAPAALPANLICAADPLGDAEAPGFSTDCYGE